MKTSILLSITGIFSMLIVGCVSTADMNAGLQKLDGKPIKEAVRILGYPDSQRMIAGDNVYTWRASRTQTYSTPQIAQTSGYLGNTPVYGTTTYSSQESINLHCVLNIATDKKGFIKNYNYSGNRGGCRRYAQILSTYGKTP